MSSDVRAYLVAYDITDDDRRMSVLNYLRGWGDHIQYSVFVCDLSATSLAIVKARLSDLVKHDEDQVLLFDLGLADGRKNDSVVAVGLPYTRQRPDTIVF